MYELVITYTENGSDIILCESIPKLKVKGRSLMINCGSGQELVINIDQFLYLRTNAPIPDKYHYLTYRADIHYQTLTEDVESLYTVSRFKFKVIPHAVTILYDGKVPRRIINNGILRSAKINALSCQENFS